MVVSFWKKKICWHHQLPPRVTPTLMTPLQLCMGIWTFGLSDVPSDISQKYSPQTKGQPRGITRQSGNITLQIIKVLKFVDWMEAIVLHHIHSRTHRYCSIFACYWSHNVMKRSVCWETGCPSVGLSVCLSVCLSVSLVVFANTVQYIELFFTRHHRTTFLVSWSQISHSWILEFTSNECAKVRYRLSTTKTWPIIRHISETMLDRVYVIQIL